MIKSDDVVARSETNVANLTFARSFLKASNLVHKTLYLDLKHTRAHPQGSEGANETA